MPAATESPVTATVTELPESRVKLEAQVAPKEVERRMAETARRLGADLRMPGFRRGKVPPPVVIQRIGRETVLDETVRSSLGQWYLEAIGAAGIKTVGEPDVDLPELPDAGKPLTFTVEIGVRPTATLGDFKGVTVERREPAADPAAVEEQVEDLRQKMGRLETADRAAARGDFVVMDFVGKLDGTPFPGGEGRDQMVELGSGRLVPGFEDQLVGASAGDDVAVEVEFPDDYQAAELAGKDAVFDVTVKEVKAKRLPELDDAFALEAAGFDTLDELKADIADKLKEQDATRAEAEFREAVVDAVVANATVEVPEALVEARARELWDRMLHSLSHQGISKEAYLQISGRPEEEILEEAKPDAEQALRREAVIAAVVAAEGIEPSDADVLDALTESAAREGVKPEKLRARLERDGRLDDLREDLAQRAAVDLLVEQAQAQPAAG
jgi:trigger factor